MGIDGADPFQRPKDTRQFRIDQGQRNLIPTVGVEKNEVITRFMCPRVEENDTYRSKVIAVLRVEGCVALQPPMALWNDDFCVWVWWQRLYLVSVRQCE